METDRDRQSKDEPERVGANAELPFDRLTVERFRDAFPRARWSDKNKAWFVPGKTASKRVGSWLARLEAETDAHADERGRDAYDFDPIVSKYLEVGKTRFSVSTPYSRTVVDELRQVAFARWDEDARKWRVPFRSYDDLRHHWPAIEAAAIRNEPEAKKARRAAAKGTEEEIAARARTTERRGHRYPVPSKDPPPLQQPIATSIGIVVFTLSHGELVDPNIQHEFYPAVDAVDLVWMHWRPAELAGLVSTWPARTEPSETERARGWWFAVLAELRPARRDARKREKRATARTPP